MLHQPSQWITRERIIKFASRSVAAMKEIDGSCWGVVMLIAVEITVTQNTRCIFK